MVNFKNIAASLAVVSIFGGAVAHPGEVHTAEEIKRELLSYQVAHIKATRSLARVADSPAALSLKARAVERRAATAQALREKRGLTHKPMFAKRDLADLTKYEGISHDVTADGYTLDTPLDVIFDSNSTTTLVPEVTIGPYFVSGEFIRTDVTEGTQGVPVHLDMQFVDINTFEPIEDLLVDIWHTNATGVYSGVSAAGQGGLNSTFLRGVGASDSDGVVEFDTIFPGHYNGRAHHIHLLVTQNSTLLPNNTYIAGKTDHIGQLFFNQDLITEVEKLHPYNTNTQGLIPTLSDSIAAQQATSDYDPLVDYVLLGDTLQDGLLAFITIGVDTQSNHSDSYKPAAHYQEGGGVDVAGGPGGPGGPSGGPGGPPPTPTGAPAPTGSPLSKKSKKTKKSLKLW